MSASLAPKNGGCEKEGGSRQYLIKVCHGSLDNTKEGLLSILLLSFCERRKLRPALAKVTFERGASDGEQ